MRKKEGSLMISRRIFLGAVSGIMAMGAAGAASACANLNEAMAHFETVKDAYVAKATQMTPEMFPVWTAHLEKFGEHMGNQNYAGACAALDQASLELGFNTEAAAPAAAETAPAAVEAPKATELPATTTESESAQLPAANDPQPSTQVAGGSAWSECPRGRCWARK